MSRHHLVVGAGPVGRHTALLLAGRGERVTLASRSGTGDALPGVRRVAVDAADADALATLADGSVAIHNAVNPPSYDVWPQWWPPVAEAFLTAAERTGALLVSAGPLYAYGPLADPDRVMTEDLPDAAQGVKGALRASMTAEAMTRHRAGRLRAVEVRGSDYMGPGVTTAHVAAVAPRALSGKGVRMFGDPRLPHSYTDVRDMARAMVHLVDESESWGRVWHAPTNEARSSVETVADVCRAAGREPVAVRAWPRAMLGLGGLVVPFLREMRETVYQFERPYVLDSSAITERFGLAPTPWEEVCAATAASALGVESLPV